MFKNILAPITPSHYCEQAIDAAIAFAQRFESNLVLFHAHGVERPWGQVEFRSTPEELEKVKVGIEEHFSEKLKGVSSYKIIVDQGIPHVEILRAAREHDSDLIVMCPYRKDVADKEIQAWGRVGSVMERVAQQARCPVMIVTRATPYGEHVFRSIVVAIDFSKQSKCLSYYAGQLAKQYNSTLTMFHVMDTNTTAKNMLQEDVSREISKFKTKMAEDYRTNLEGVKSCTYECWEGDPETEILKLARIKNADVILMAHHSKKEDPEAALLGSTTAHVAVHSLCPVMSINHEFEMRCKAK